MKIGVPSGIGDISWVVSKLINAPEWGDLELEIADGWPYRAKPYLDMVGVKNGYGEFRYDDIVAFEHAQIKGIEGKDPKWDGTWRCVVEKEAGRFLLQPNHHLERGMPLINWLPDLPVDYHYKMTIPPLSKRLEHIVAFLREGNWIGISCASYRGAAAWKTWGVEEWKELTDFLIKAGWRVCLMGGRWDDLTDALFYEIEDGLAINLVGKTEFGDACEIHKLLRGYIGFSSGLGIIRTVMGLPTLMLWPEHQQPLSTSWADPEDLLSNRYVARPYLEPKFIAKIFLNQMKEMEGT